MIADESGKIKRPDLGQSWCQLNHDLMAYAMETCRMGHDQVSILEKS